MARIQLTLPESFVFCTAIDVRVTDMNYGCHLGNDSMLSLVHEARCRFLQAQGATEGNIDGTAMVLADAAVVYLAEVFAGDRLRFEVAIGDVTRVGCDFYYRVIRDGDDKRVAEAKTGAVFLDPKTRRITATPQLIRDLDATRPQP